MPASHHRTDRGERSYAVRIPADVDREDRVLANLTARQVAILATVGAVLYAGYAATRTVLPQVVFLVAAVPVVVAAGVLVLGTRDGLSLDRLVGAAIRQRLTPRVQVAADGGITPPPDWLSARAVTPAGQPYRADAVAPANLRLPAQAVDGDLGEVGVVDLGPDGLAVVCVCSTVNFALRTDAEQESLVASFGRYLHSLSAPVQILIRAQRLDLSGQIAELRERAGGLPHPALEAAAREHADYLAQLVDHADLLRRQVLLVLREPGHAPASIGAARLLSRLIPAPRSRSVRSDDGEGGLRLAAETRLARRVTETRQLLAPAGIVLTPLDAGQATAVLASACNPDTLIRPDTAFAAASDVITLTTADSDLSPDPTATAPDPWDTAPVEAIDPDTPYNASVDAGDDEMWWAR
jgi:hypothetical protein